MAVDFVMRKAPAYVLATRTLTGSWPGDKKLRSEFEKLEEWAKQKGLRTGKWVFRELGDMDAPAERMKFELGVEVVGKGRPRGSRGVSIRTLPASTVASVTFDPDKVAARLVYHGLTDWLRWREKEKEYKVTGFPREVYSGNPWRSTRAWKSTQVQFPVKKLAG